jgi:hypothetical protein
MLHAVATVHRRIVAVIKVILVNRVACEEKATSFDVAFLFLTA